MTAFKFLHAGDFRLHQVVCGLAEIPDALRESLLEAPFLAARQVVDSALAEQVSFVVLGGNLLQPLEGGSRGIAFLLNELYRLEQAGIRVYWSTGSTDAADRWPAGISFPPNVTMFGDQQVETVPHPLSDGSHVNISGRSGTHRINSDDYPATADDSFHIAVSCSKAAGDAAQADRVHYWALSGRMSSDTLREEPQHVARYAGSPQGRAPTDTGVHGCLLIDVDQDHTIHSRQIATDVVRWHSEALHVPDSASTSDVLRLMRERIRQLPVSDVRGPLLVNWQLAISHHLAGSLRQGHLTEELLRALNSASSASAGSVWSMSLEASVGGELPEHLYQEQTILGDYLRAVQTLRADEEPLPLAQFLGSRAMDKSLRELVEIADTRQRDDILREAALLGAELLRGEG